MSLPAELTKAFKQQSRSGDFWIHLALLVLLFVSLSPVAVWTIQTTNDQSRLFHAVVVLALAISVLIRFGNVEIKAPLSLNPSAKRALIAAYGLLAIQLGAAPFLSENLRALISMLAIPACCCAIAAAIRFILGEGTTRITATAAGTLCAFIILSQLMAPLDWPLRHIAGEWSAAGLNLLGKTVELGLTNGGDGPPKLILAVNNYPFHVASECNGFGVILSGILIALLLALHQRLKIFDAALNVLAGFILGFAFNIVRIVIIILLAPALMDHYMLMHEIVGGITYWGSLVLIWITLKGPTRDSVEQD